MNHSTSHRVHGSTWAGDRREVRCILEVVYERKKPLTHWDLLIVMPV